MSNLKNAATLRTWLDAYTHGAPRTWSELMSALVGPNFDRDDLELTSEEWAAVRYYQPLLKDLCTVTHASDPRHDLYCPKDA